MSVYLDPMTGLPAIDFDGCPRLLAKLPPDPAKRRLLTPFREAVPLVPESEWREINRRDGLPWIINQQNHGSCVGFSSAGALMRARAINGSAPVTLSGSYVYSWINGGRDQGAVITDALAVLRDKGTCREALCDWDTIYRQQVSREADEDARRFRLLEAYTADTWDEILSAVQLGYLPIFAVMVGDSFASTDSDGVAGFDRGPGNHAVHADGCKRLSGLGWVLDMVNSWGPKFGQAGRCYLMRRHIESVQQDCYVIRAAADDPQDPNQPPIAQ